MVDIETDGESFRMGDTRTIAHVTSSTAYDSFDIIPGTDRIVVVNRSAEALTPISVVFGLEKLLRESE